MLAPSRIPKPECWRIRNAAMLVRLLLHLNHRAAAANSDVDEMRRINPTAEREQQSNTTDNENHESHCSGYLVPGLFSPRASMGMFLVIRTDVGPDIYLK